MPYSAPEQVMHKTDFLSEQGDAFSFGLLADELIFEKLSIV